MSLSNILTTASNDAVRRAVGKGLSVEARKLYDLERALQESTQLEALLGGREEDFLVVLPISSSPQTDFQKEIVRGMDLSYTNVGGKRTDYEGRVAYSFQIKPEKTSIFNALGMRFEVSLVAPEGLDLTVQQKVKTPRVVRDIPSLPEGEWYFPKVTESDEFDVSLSSPTCLKYKLISTPAGVRDKFPGYRVPFIVNYGDGKKIETWVAAGNKGDLRGEVKGHYFCRGMKPFFEANPDLKIGDALTFKVLQAGRTDCVYEVRKK